VRLTCAFNPWPFSIIDAELLVEFFRITKMREHCMKEFDEHWNCLERNNQVGLQFVLTWSNLERCGTGILPLPKT
jgi:hypothetical protein